MADAQFGADVGFYVFELPFLGFVLDWLFVAWCSCCCSLAAHVLNGGILFASPMPSVRPARKGHIAVLLAVLAALKAADYWVCRYELTNERRGFVQGATYAVVNAQLPALMLLMLIALLTAGLFLSTLRTGSWRLPLLASALWLVVLVAGGLIYPALVQRSSSTRTSRPASSRTSSATWRPRARRWASTSTRSTCERSSFDALDAPRRSRPTSTRCTTSACSTRREMLARFRIDQGTAPGWRSTTSTSTATTSTGACSRCWSPPGSSTSTASPTRAGRATTSSTPAAAAW